MKKKLLTILVIFIILTFCFTGCTNGYTEWWASKGEEKKSPSLTDDTPGQNTTPDGPKDAGQSTLPVSKVYRMKVVYHHKISHITSLASCIMHQLPELTYPRVLVYARPTRFYFDEGVREYNMGPAPLVFSMLDIVKNSNFCPTIGYRGIPTNDTKILQDNLEENCSVLKECKNARQLFQIIKMKVVDSLPVIAQVDLKELGITDKTCYDFVIITGYDQEHVYVYFTWKMDALPTKIVFSDFIEAWSVDDDTAVFSSNFILCPNSDGQPPNIRSMEDILREDALQAPDNIEEFINYVDDTQHIPAMIGDSGQQMAHAASIYYEELGQSDLSQLYNTAVDIYSKMEDNMEVEEYLEICRQLKEVYRQAALLMNNK
ncbi:MAG TPA: hypothetical protein GXZ32_08260 [Clostridiales bacterium]|nr:hypothetical protein [Clostridiales bacterium]